MSRSVVAYSIIIGLLLMFLGYQFGADHYRKLAYPHIFTYQSLLDDGSLSYEEKWKIFLAKRAEWKLCTEDEMYKEVDGRAFCRKIPIEFKGE